MSTDNFAQVTYNDGEQVVYGDLTNGQRFLAAKLSDQLFAKLIPRISPGVSIYGDPQFQGELGASIGTADASLKSRAYALTPGGAYPWVGTAFFPSRTLAKNAVGIAPGTLFQLVGDDDAGTDANLLAYTFNGTETVTIAAGDATHPRVDLIQATLSYATSSENRIFAELPIKADLDLSTVTTHDNGKIRAKNSGKGGDSISISYAKRTSGSGVTYSENGNAILVQYEDGVSTVADRENAIIANSTLVEIESTGTGTNVLHHPADSFAYTHLAGGADELLVTQLMPTKRFVQCVLSVKQGAPAASPAYPTPDAGACVIGAVVVGTNYAITTQITAGWDTAGAVAVLHDCRVPLGVRSFRVGAPQLAFDGTDWALSGRGNVVTAAGAGKFLSARCPIGGHAGRVIAVAVRGAFHAGATAKLAMYGGDARFVADVTAALINADNTDRFRIATLRAIEVAGVFAAGPSVTADATSGIGPPVWTSCQRTPYRPFESSNDVGLDPTSTDAYETTVELQIVSGGADTVFGVTFFVAEGL